VVFIREVKQNLQRKCCADGHENDDFDTTNLSFDSKVYGEENPMFYVLD